MDKICRYILGCMALVGLVCSGQLWASGSLATGRWVRISVGESGLYGLSADELRGMGFADPARVRVFGYGGALLPEQIVRLAGHGLAEVPTLMEGSHLYFYGQGTTSWTYSASDDFYHHTTNHYSLRGHYLLTEGDSPLRMQTTVATRPAQPADGADTYIATLLHEQDTYSLSGSGRRLYGESFQMTQQRSYTHTVPGARSARATLASMAYPRTADATLSLSLNGTTHAQTTVTLTAMNNLAYSGTYHVYGIHRTHTPRAWVPLSGDRFDISLALSVTGTVAHLDYYELNVLATLAYPGYGQLTFSRPPVPATASSIDYVMTTGGSDVRIFRVDASTEASLVDVSAARQGGELRMTLPALDRHGRPSRYIAARLSDAMRPTIEGALASQNLRGQQVAPDLFVITTESLRAESERLAAHYRGQGHAVLVATQQEVFNEFNAGTPDATAYRLAIRHLVDLYRATRGTSDVDMQVLLVGDGAYDNRKITAEWQAGALGRTEFLLSYQSVNSLDLSSYSSDDYFGVISDERPRSGSGASAIYPELYELPMDVGVGRLPVRTPAEAAAVIDKIIRYETVPDYGPWRMRAAFVADNGDGNSHTRQSVEISQQLEADHPEIRLDKLYMSAFPRQSVNGQITVPGAKKAILEALDRGVILINYNGHGNPKSWADEQVLTQSDIQRFTHRHLPLWVTATCDFAPFDAIATSSGEEVLLHPTSGGVALLSTTRVVYDLPNVMLNKALLKEMFTQDAQGRYRPLGRIVRDAKNALRLKSSPENRLNFVLLGSPLTRIVMPPTQATVASIAGQTVDGRTAIEAAALDRVTIEGTIMTEAGAIDGDFSGTIDVTIYDGEQTMETIDNFNRAGATVAPVSYKDYVNIIYTGRAAVKQGRYSLELVVPRDVSYSGYRGLISLYALDSVRGVDVVGVDKSLRIRTGGTGALSDDTNGPELLALLLGGRSVTETPRIPSTAELYAELRDGSAVNLSGAGIGHRIRLIIDGRSDMSYDLSGYYTPDGETAGRGSVRFSVPELPAGAHTARLEAWDVYNNATTSDFAFVVQPGLAPQISRLSLTRSETATTLQIWHDQAGVSLDALVRLYDMSGRLLGSQTAQRVQTSGATPVAIDLTPTAGPLPPGTYIAAVSLGATESGAMAYASLLWQAQ